MLGDPSDQRAITVEPDEVLTPTPVKRRPEMEAPRPARGAGKDPTPPTVVSTGRLAGIVGGKRSPQDTTGVVVGHSAKRAMPVQHESTAWGRLIFLMLLLLATAGGAYWYLFLRQ
jgi:hypothetical protein